MCNRKEKSYVLFEEQGMLRIPINAIEHELKGKDSPSPWVFFVINKL